MRFLCIVYRKLSSKGKTGIYSRFFIFIHFSLGILVLLAFLLRKEMNKK